MSDAKSPSELSIDEILTTIRRIIAEDEQAGGQSTTSSGATAATADPATGTGGAPGGEETDDKAGVSDDVLELTEAINEDGTTRHLAPIGGSARRTAATGQTPPAVARAGPLPEPPPQRREAPNLRRTPEQPAAAPREQRLPRDLALGAGERTLEDIVSDVLRPLLQTWLDQNLPPLVERLVQAEITRVAREAGAA
jgi:cell pole-organizing protein PopZ